MKYEQRQQIEALLERAKHVHYFSDTQKKVVDSMSLLLGKSEKDSPEAKAYGDLVRRAHLGDADAQTQMHALVLETTVNFLTATMNFGRLFEMRTLADNQSPVIQNNTRNQIAIAYLSQEGEPRWHKVVKPQTETLVDLYILASEWVWYALRDLYTGDVSEAARVMFDITYDLKAKLEDVLKTLALTAIGAFDVTAANKSARVYNASDRFLSGALPTTNDLSIASVGTSTKFGLATVATEVLDYCSRFAGSDPSGDLRPTGELIVPVQDIREVMDSITITSAAQNQAAQDTLARGWLDLPPVLGVNWRIVPDNTIARKACYAVLNKPLGILWNKPSFGVVEEVVERSKNRARRMESLAFGAAIPTPNKRNLVKVTYRT